MSKRRNGRSSSDIEVAVSHSLAWIWEPLTTRPDRVEAELSYFSPTRAVDLTTGINTSVALTVDGSSRESSDGNRSLEAPDGALKWSGR